MNLPVDSILKRAFLQGTVAKLKPRTAHCLPLAASVADVIRLYEMAHVGSVLVLDDNEQLQGIFTERDLITKYMPNRPYDTIRIPEVMSSPVQTIKASSSIARLLYLMTVGHFRHVPVYMPSARIPHMVSIRDVLEFIYRSVTKMLAQKENTDHFDEVVVKKFFSADVRSLEAIPAVTAFSSSIVSKALMQMQLGKQGAIVVASSETPLAGIFTERDFVTRVLLKNLDPAKTRLSEVMTPHPVAVELDTKLSIVFTLMSEGGYRHLPVKSKEGALTGIISIKKVFDLLTRSVLEELEQAAH